MPSVRTPFLEIGYLAAGAREGAPVVLLHGFPYDPHVYDEVVPPLVSAGCYTLVPFLRGYGPTRFLSAETPRSGQQAALGKDLLDFLDALGLSDAILVGFDWGGRAACVVAALWPERARGLVTCGGYNIQNIAASVKPAAPEQEHRLWFVADDRVPRVVGLALDLQHNVTLPLIAEEPRNLPSLPTW